MAVVDLIGNIIKQKLGRTSIHSAKETERESLDLCIRARSLLNDRRKRNDVTLYSRRTNLTWIQVKRVKEAVVNLRPIYIVVESTSTTRMLEALVERSRSAV